MRSADLSGVGEGGFGSVLRHVSPLTYAVTVTAFIAATIFVVADTLRTVDEVADRDLSHPALLLARREQGGEAFVGGRRIPRGRLGRIDHRGFLSAPRPEAGHR